MGRIQNFVDGVQNVSLTVEGIWEDRGKDEETNSNKCCNRL